MIASVLKEAMTLQQHQGMKLLLPAKGIKPQPGSWHAASGDVQTIKREIDDWLYDEVEGVVQNGPFSGMRLLRDVARKDTFLAPMLLGAYEEELHGEITRQINRLKKIPNPKISVMGCAEGYYAIGLKRHLPNAAVYVADTDKDALEICHRAAAANDVSPLISGALLSTAFGGMDLIFMDCEGAETLYLDCAKFPTMSGTAIIVEIHDFMSGPEVEMGTTSKIILERFRGSHRITCVFEGPRDPNKYDQLTLMTSEYRWMAVCEGRPCTMCWFLMEPRGWYVS